MAEEVPTRVIKVFKGYTSGTVVRKIGAGGIAARYQKASTTSSSTTVTISAPTMTLNLMRYMRGTIVAGSLRFKIGNLTYVDRSGVLYHTINPTTGAGVAAGTVNYQSGVVTVTALPTSGNAFVLESGLINPGSVGMAAVAGRTASRPLKSQSFNISATALDGTVLSAQANANGVISGTLVSGGLDVETGIYTIAFGEVVGSDWVSKLVDPSTLRYNTVSYTYLPLDADILGVDPVRLPQDGRVPIFREGGFVVIGNTGTVGPQTVSNGQTINCGRVRLSRVRVIGNDGNVIDTGYSANLEAGTVSFSTVAGYSQPVTIEHRVEDMLQVSDVQINGQLTFTRQITHAYPVGSVVSSALVSGDLRARVSVFFDQATWTNTWADEISGSAATGTYNDVLSPIVVTNDGATNERWAIQFTNTTSFNVMGEHVGVIATGNTATDLAPINPATNRPYFTLNAVGWGAGWAAGNVLRFNTVGALFPIWVVRTVQQGQETVTNDAFTLLIRGDVDQP